mmetsp:Transcript_31610/g.52169  ORF Transcript_31610/g.52169 Transcript_31610/m.52169 type:complete len:155 (-) Transcript_31610:209-673(-)|eukprot:CAMPEP_0119012620 /NCGR_PEP_ID=MMETSP1176-20130426/7093_1 /TAXON_ID=265551 /ORGANISM="Synedropsis recta cf, Strain CCMP1620" /LENGTH=154 /DNA_ID=CAMNT_0006965615 /DNA_START=51 /DNA_END=515 /DNA_ORIENTATION=-
MALRFLCPMNRVVSPTIQRYLATTSSAQVQTDDAKFSPVYVHHLSKIVLEHLQNNYSGWIVNRRLEKGLKLNPDGTFVLRFPASIGRKDNGRIWTSYDGGKKQHWLSVYKDGSLGRFLIKDVLEGGDLSEVAVNDHVRSSVDRLIGKLDGSSPL